MDLLNDILKVQKLAREDKIQSFQSMFTEEPVAVKVAHAKAQQVQELEDLKVKQEKELESLKDRHERENSKLGLEKEKETENVAIQKKRDATRKANESVELDEAVKWSMGDGKPRGGSNIENVRFWDLPKASLEYIQKDSKDAMKANPSNKKNTQGKGNYADQINDAQTVLIWRKKNGIKESVELEESKVTCPECGGKGCDHCDDTGYHIKEGKLVTSAVDIIKLITKKVADRLEKEYSRNPEKGLGMINTIGAMVGHKVTDKEQSKGKLFLKFGEELEEGRMQDAIKKMKGLSKKQMEFLMTIPQQQLTVIAQQLAGLTMGEEGEELEERHADVMRKRNQSQQKAHQKAMMKSAKKSIKDYDAKNKNKNEESEVEEDRDYKKEYESYHKDPEQIKRRAKRNEARRSLKNQKKLTADKDVHHKDNNPMNNDKSNLSIVTQNYNRKEPRMRDKLKEKGCLPNAKRK